MKQVKYLFTLLAVFIMTTSYSQTEELLNDLPTTKEAFVASEKKVIATINWLENTPLDQNPNLRDQQKALFLAWITNSPTVSIEVNAKTIPFSEKNPELLIIYMGGWTKYSLENSYSENLVKCNLAGIKSAIKVYKKGVGIKKDKSMEKLIELDEKEELEKWITEQLAKK